MSRLHRQLLSLARLACGRGRTDAVRLWPVLWSHAQRHGRDGDVWPGNKRLADLVGFSVRRVQRALALLRASGLISIRWGRPWRARKVRRIITLAPGVERTSNPRVKIIDPAAIPAILRMLRPFRKRPGACVGLLMAIYACAQMNGGGASHVTMRCLEEMTGAGHGQTFYARLDVLEASGLISRVGERWSDGIEVADIERAQHMEMVRAVNELPTPRVRVAMADVEAQLAMMSEAFARCHYDARECPAAGWVGAA